MERSWGRERKVSGERGRLETEVWGAVEEFGMSYTSGAAMGQKGWSRLGQQAGDCLAGGSLGIETDLGWLMQRVQPP